MSPWSAEAKQDAAKGARGDRFLLVHLAAPVVLEDLPVAEKNRREWNRLVSRRFRVLQVHTGDRSRVLAPG